MYFSDPLGQALDCYHFEYIYLLQVCFVEEVVQFLSLQPFQIPMSKLFGHFCIYFAHIIFTYSYPYAHYLNNDDLIRFAKQMM